MAISRQRIVYEWMQLHEPLVQKHLSLLLSTPSGITNEYSLKIISLTQTWHSDKDKDKTRSKQKRKIKKKKNTTTRITTIHLTQH